MTEDDIDFHTQLSAAVAFKSRASRYATLEPLGYGNQNYQGHQ